MPHSDTAAKRADIVFSQLIRERADYRCEVCRGFFRHDPSALHCSHLVAGRRFSIRWRPLAAAAHCWKCHSHLEHNRNKMKAWAKAHLGDAEFMALEILRNRSVQIKRHDHKEIIANLKASLKHMKAQREAGETGRLEFDDPYPEHFTTAQGEAV